jgi:ABC-type polysaccharide/polyol phosphate export permease
MKKLVKKDLKLFFVNKQDMLLTFALPIIFITLFSFVFGNMGNTEEDKLGGLVHVVAGTSVMISFTNLTDECYTAIVKKWKDIQRFDDTIHFYSMNVQADLSKILLKIP